MSDSVRWAALARSEAEALRWAFGWLQLGGLPLVILAGLYRFLAAGMLYSPALWVALFLSIGLCMTSVFLLRREKPSPLQALILLSLLPHLWLAFGLLFAEGGWLWLSIFMGVLCYLSVYHSIGKWHLYTKKENNNEAMDC